MFTNENFIPTLLPPRFQGAYESGQIWRDCPCLHRTVCTAVTGQESQDRVQLAGHCNKGLLPGSKTGFPLGACPEGSEVIPNHLTLLWK